MDRHLSALWDDSGEEGACLRESLEILFPEMKADPKKEIEEFKDYGKGFTITREMWDALPGKIPWPPDVWRKDAQEKKALVERLEKENRRLLVEKGWISQENATLRSILLDLRKGACWCLSGVGEEGDERAKRHTEVCRRAQRVLRKT